MMVLIPELIIYDNLIKLFNFINLDFAAHTANEDKSILYQIFKIDINQEDLTFNKTDYYEQAKNVFILRNNDSHRKIEVALGFNMQRASLPTIHIMMPSETPGISPIGTNLGYAGSLSTNNSHQVHNVYTVGFSASYSLIITSDNSLEVILMYILLKSCFIGIKTQLELSGFQNVQYGGSDLILNMDFVPPGMFTRNFNVNFNYDFCGRDVFETELPVSFNSTGIPQ